MSFHKEHSRLIHLKFTALFAGLLTACQVADAQRGFVSFNKLTLDDAMRGGYGVELADVDGDGLTDIIAVATNPAQFSWYKNPAWEKYDISSTAQGNIDAAPKDIDGDGDVDMVLASEFALGASTEGGKLHWLENPGDPTVNQEWQMHFIDEIPTTHRIKWGDVNGDDREELINLPIIGIGATAPDYAVDLQLKAYSIPPDLSVDHWPGVVLDRTLQLAHGLALDDWDGDDREDIFTASASGVHLFRLAYQGQPIARSRIGEGKQDAERPAIGSSEVDVGTLGMNERFIATVEPWHGNEVVVYTRGDADQTLWQRNVIDTEFNNGHGLQVADLNNDGIDEIIAGSRSEPYKMAIFSYDASAASWNRSDLDDGNIALSGIAIADINGDGFQDIVGIGAGTQNVVYYENQGL